MPAEADRGGSSPLYTVICWAAAVVTLLRLVWLRYLLPAPPLVRFHGERRVEIDPRSARFALRRHRITFSARLPLNEILRLEVTDWMLDMPRLAAALDGLSIVHLSDFHLTGRVGKAYLPRSRPHQQ